MNPLIQHLHTVLPGLPPLYVGSSLQWNFDVSLKTLNTDFYNKILDLHPILNVEYSILCTQIRDDLLNKKRSKHVIERLTTALLLCELLKYTHQHYLIAPREVARLNKNQQLLRTLLSERAGYSFISIEFEEENEKASFSFAPRVHDLTVEANGYRILINRSKRLVNVLNAVITDSKLFNTWVFYLDKYTNPLLAIFGLLFHLPRLLTNLSILMKQIFYGPQISNKAGIFDWQTRLVSQLQRCWFELGNDTVWTIVGALNMCVLLGALAVTATYFSVIAFGFDVINAMVRAWMELHSLYHLRKDYNMLAKSYGEPHDLIDKHLDYIEKRIRFDHKRFTLHVSGTALVFINMALSLPIFGLSAVAILASAIFLLLLWGVVYALTQKLEKYRPKDNLDDCSSAKSPHAAKVSQSGFFAPKKEGYTCKLARVSSKLEYSRLY